MLGKILRYRPHRRPRGGQLALILVLTPGVIGGVVLADRPGGEDEMRAARATRPQAPRPIVWDIDSTPPEQALSSTQALPSTPTPPPAPGPADTRPAPIRAPEARPEPVPWVASSEPLSGSPPVRVDIPAVGITARIGPLGLNRDRTLEVPRDFSRAGWYTGRPTPGEAGPAIIVAHRAGRRSGPGAFWRLPELQPGQEVVVTRADGTRVLFVVDRLEQHRKSAFPTNAVYGPTPEVALRLITCGGPFEPTLGDHYRDNVIAFAHMTGWAA